VIQIFFTSPFFLNESLDRDFSRLVYLYNESRLDNCNKAQNEIETRAVLKRVMSMPDMNNPPQSPFSSPKIGKPPKTPEKPTSPVAKVKGMVRRALRKVNSDPL
jgi:hypothetical protein